MARRPRAFISFDYDYDLDLRNLLVGQARHADTPFEIADWSVRERQLGDWKAKVRRRIRAVDVVIVLCGHHTDDASGVSEEIKLARAERKPYFLLAGRKSGTVRKPRAARPTDKVYRWTWDNLKKLIHGRR
ncbi:MAG TPA: TIR domain-containing protein [Gaiellaceae bacterium]|jgi:hypothetical protein